MTEPTSSFSRRTARSSGPSRPVPTARNLEDADFFAWVGLYAQFLEQFGVPFDDTRALRTWQALDAEPGFTTVALERSGHLCGFAFAAPVIDACEGGIRLEVTAVFVERVESDGVALEALVEALHNHAVAAGANKLSWRLPPAHESFARLSSQFGELTEFGSYEMRVRR